jgi:hypothetical protein
MTKTNYTFGDSDEASLRLRNLANLYEPDTRSLLKRSEVGRPRLAPLSAIERSIYRSCLDGKSRYSCSNGGRNYFVRMISLPGLPAIEPL